MTHTVNTVKLFGLERAPDSESVGLGDHRRGLKDAGLTIPGRASNK